jgi:hypothetical protein
MPRAAPALLAALLAAACRSGAAGSNGPTVFAALSDWGGTGAPPYTTPSQVAVAEAMSVVGGDNPFSFVLSAGNNFLPAGLPGARAAHACCRCLPLWGVGPTLRAACGARPRRTFAPPRARRMARGVPRARRGCAPRALAPHRPHAPPAPRS